MKKIILSLLCMALCFAMLGTAVSAKERYATGLLPEDPEVILKYMDPYGFDIDPNDDTIDPNSQFAKDFINRKYLPYDVFDDQCISSTDARYALMAAAKIIELNENELAAADTNSDGKVNSADARRMLCVAAKLDKISADITLTVGQKYTVDKLFGNETFPWNCIADSATSEMITFSTVYPPEKEHEVLGDVHEYIYTFSAERPGQYSFSLIYSEDYEIFYNITVK